MIGLHHTLRLSSATLALSFATPSLAQTSRIAPPPGVDMTFASVRPFNGAGIAWRGNVFSYCSIDGCLYRDGPNAGAASALDHQRATALFSSITNDDGHSQENTLGLETTIETGWKTPWAADTGYAAGANVITSSSLVYRANKGCKSGKAPPTGYTASSWDGGCSWSWINGGALDAKVGFYNAVRVKQGAGPAWGSAENVVIEAGPRQPGVTQKELDITNLGPAASIGSPPIFGLDIGVGGNTITAALQLGSAAGTTDNPGSLFGAWLTGHLSGIADIENDTSSPIGIGFNTDGLGGQHSSAAIKDASGGPYSYLVSGNHTRATIFDGSLSPSSLRVGGAHSIADIDLMSNGSAAGLLFHGKYTAYQIAGRGFSVDADGVVNFAQASAPHIVFSRAAGVAGTANRIGLFGTVYGFGVSADSLDYVAPEGAAHAFYVSGAKVAAVGSNGFRGILATPASSHAACSAGDFMDDKDYHYVCVAADTWKRVKLLDF